MKDVEIVARFDGSPRVTLDFPGFESFEAERAMAIAHELGYKLQRSDLVARVVYRLEFIRDDSPQVRRHAENARLRLVHLSDGRVSLWPHRPLPDNLGLLITPGQAARARHGTVLYSGWRPTPLIVACILAALVLVFVAWRVRSEHFIAGFVLVAAVLCLVAAKVGPSYVKKWHARNLEILDRYEQQRAAISGTGHPPLPPPPAPPASRDKGRE